MYENFFHLQKRLSSLENLKYDLHSVTRLLIFQSLDISFKYVSE